MTVREEVALAPMTSLGIGGPARFFIEAGAEDELVRAAAFAKERDLPLRVLGGGTNILVPDEGVDAVVVRIVAHAIRIEEGEGGAVALRADAGARWDDLVDHATSFGAWGVENLAGIPGSAGGALVQNIGAYGAELADTFAAADAYDLSRGAWVRIEKRDAEFGYRTSVFKHRPDLVIWRLMFRLAREGAPRLAYADLARAKEAGEPLRTPCEVAETVRAIRSRKFPAGGAGTAGSFFKNPRLDGRAIERLLARYPELPVFREEGSEGGKVPLAWLLDHALGLAGYADGPVRLFERQPLVLVAERGARASDVDRFADEIARRAHDELGIAIEREAETFRAR